MESPRIYAQHDLNEGRGTSGAMRKPPEAVSQHLQIRPGRSPAFPAGNFSIRWTHL